MTRSRVRAESIRASATLSTRLFQTGTGKRTREALLSPPGSADHELYEERDLDVFTCAQLKQTCRSRGWEGFSGLNKHGLVKFVEGKLLQTEEAIFDRKRRIVSRPSRLVNDCDAISQLPLEGRPALYTFKLDAPSSHHKPIRCIYRFDPFSLVQMIHSTGEAVNPFTREPLSEDDLCRLEHLYATCLRLHPRTPKNKKAILSKRPDMSAALISAAPERQELQLEEDDDIPGPVNGDFAPWLTSETLAEMGTRRRAEILEANQHDETRAYLISDATQSLSVALAVVRQRSQRGNDAAFNVAVSSAFMQYVISDLSPRIGRSWEVLCMHDSVAGLQMLTHFVNSIRGNCSPELDDSIILTLNIWLLAYFLDHVLEFCEERAETHPESITRVWEEAKRLGTAHSTSTLVTLSMQRRLHEVEAAFILE